MNKILWDESFRDLTVQLARAEARRGFLKMAGKVAGLTAGALFGSSTVAWASKGTPDCVPDCSCTISCDPGSACNCHPGDHSYCGSCTTSHGTIGVTTTVDCSCTTYVNCCTGVPCQTYCNSTTDCPDCP
jgi:hypothetical protein